MGLHSCTKEGMCGEQSWVAHRSVLRARGTGGVGLDCRAFGQPAAGTLLGDIAVPVSGHQG